MKNLENEYRKQIEENVPDLWDRINAGIDKLEEEKENSSVNNIEENNKVVSISKKKTAKRIIPTLVAAAALMLSLGLFMMANSRKSEAPAAEASFDEAACESAEYEASEESMYEASEEAASEESMYEASEEAASEEVAEGSAYDGFADFAPSKETANSSVEAMEEAVSEDKAADALDVIEYYGTVTLCDNPEFIEIVLDNGKTEIVYVPSKLQSLIETAAKGSHKLHITCEKTDEEMRNAFPNGYKDTGYQITNLYN